MVDFNRVVGGVALPVAAPTTKESLEDLTPARLMVDVFAAGIRADLNAAFRASASGTALDGRRAVEHTAPTEPTKDYIETSKCDFPALFVYLTGEDEPEEKQFTQSLIQTTTLWTVEYVLGPLTPENYERLQAALTVTRGIVSQICHAGGHPAYAMDANNVWPKQVFTEWGLSSVAFKRLIAYGGASFEEGGTKYYGARWSVQAVTYGGPNGQPYGAAPHVGADFNLNLRSEDEQADEDAPLGTDWDGFVKVRSDLQ